MPEATACSPAVVADTIMRTIELGVTITDAAVDDKTTTIFCTPVARDARYPDCGHDGRYRDNVTRPLTDLPVAGYPLVLRVAVPRYRCTTPECGRAVFNQDLGKLAASRSATTRRCARYVLRRLMIDRTTVAAIAAELGVSWHTVSSVNSVNSVIERAERPCAMSAAQISELVEKLGGLSAVLGEATGPERARVYASLGLRLDYDPYPRRVRATADLSRVAGCVRGRLGHLRHGS